MDGISFICTSNSCSGSALDGWTAICPISTKIIYIADDMYVPTGHQYNFGFVFTPSSDLSPPTAGHYIIYWQLAYNRTLFGPEEYMKVTVTN